MAPWESVNVVSCAENNRSVNKHINATCEIKNLSIIEQLIILDFKKVVVKPLKKNDTQKLIYSDNQLKSGAPRKRRSLLQVNGNRELAYVPTCLIKKID